MKDNQRHSNFLRPLYPEDSLKLIKEYNLAVGPAAAGETHRLYIAEYGNPNGIPVVVCHGGPGAGTTPRHALFFNPTKYRIILFDQRGAGKSTPQHCMENNTSQFLIKDMEDIRQMLGINKWVVFGGSWGSTLSLLYAEAHPERVYGLILRGIWLARFDDLYGYLREDKPGPKLKPEKWRTFKAAIDALRQEANLNIPMDDMINVLYELITKGSESIKQRTVILVAKWELTVCFLNEPPEEELDKLSKSNYGVGTATAEITYKKHRCFIKENQILEDIHKIKEIKIWIVHGMYDICTPADQAADLVTALRETGGKIIHFYRPMAGHNTFEAGNIDALVRSTDELAEQLNLS